MQSASADVLHLGLLAARLSQAAYEETHHGLMTALAQVPSEMVSNLSLVGFTIQEKDYKNFAPQWYVAREGADGAASRIFLVFRGAYSPFDALRNLCVLPFAHGDGQYHGGFLGGLTGNNKLNDTLQKALYDNPCAELFVTGHSLGGAMALTYVAAGLVPDTFEGCVTAVAIGSPAVLYTDPKNRSVQGPAGAARARLLAFANRADVVPRVLGSPLAVSRILFNSIPNLSHFQGVLNSLENYSHIPRTQVVWVNPNGKGGALAPLSDQHDAVLHVHKSFSRALYIFGDHGLEGYIRGIETALEHAV